MNMSLQKASRLPFICVICLFLSTIVALAGVSIDPMQKDRIRVGPDKTYDWVNIGCVYHISPSGAVVEDYCDHTIIRDLWEDPNIPGQWIIVKEHSKWRYIQATRQEDSEVQLLAKF